MKIKRLGLRNFRNCADLRLDFDTNKVLIIGKNAQGKTNILESIYFLSDLKSPRTSTVLDLIKFQEEKFEINAEIEKNQTNIELDFAYNIEKKREHKINKVKSSAKDFRDVVKTVLFSTKDLLILRGSPENRREWLDRAISQIYPAYDERLSKYDKIRIQKNNLLKNDIVDETLLEIYNEQLTITGANIVFLRKKFLKEIENIASQKHNSISDNENLKINYTCPENDIEKISEYLKEQLIERKQEEIARHQSCVGPHRDDIEFKINEIDAIKFASQGQQRTLILSLKLSEIDIIKEKTGYSPILLLDDVLAELDDIRQNYLLKSIDKNTQTIITSVDTLLFDKEFLDNIRIYNIENGQIKKGAEMILVTGGAGYIGSHTVIALLEEGYDVVIFDNLENGHIETVETLKKYGNVKFIQGDLRKLGDIQDVFKANKISAVLHFAAYAIIEESVKNPQKYYYNNVYGTLNLLNSMIENGVKDIIFSSTAATYGEPKSIPINEEHPQNPINPYGMSKLMAEKIIEDFEKAYGLRFVKLRYFNAIGADSKLRIGEWHEYETHIIPNILRTENNGIFKIYGDDYNTPDGTCVRDYINVEDLASAHLLGLKYLKNGGCSSSINLGTKCGNSVKEILKTCENIIGKHIPNQVYPKRTGDPARLVADNSKAKKILHWSPQKNLEYSIKTAFEWNKVLNKSIL